MTAAFAEDSSLARPTLMYVEGGSSDITVANLRFQDPPNVFHSTGQDSTRITYSGLTLYAVAVDDIEVYNSPPFPTT
jgi:hypothetical protein